MLILCEKPSVAKDFAAALGATRKNGYYQGGQYTITFCVGHLFELSEPESYDPKYKKWTFEDLPIVPDVFRYEINKSTAEQAAIVIDLLKQHYDSTTLIATDAGREGELIARIVLQEAGLYDTDRYSRFWVSEALTPEVILKGIQNARNLHFYDSLSDQAFARQRADWLVGINLTRFMSIGNPPPTFSVGRVQTAVLSAIASRNTEVKNFVPVPYKELEASICSKDGVRIKALLLNPKTDKTSFLKEDEEYLLAALENSKNCPVSSVDVTSVKKSLSPPKLLNITGLQKEAFKRFGYKPEETLTIAQSLYENHKCLSYPRTPSRVMGDNNVDLFMDKFKLLAPNSSLSSLSDPSLIHSGNKHIFNSAQLEDHHALIPLLPIPSSANDKEQKVYSIVLESFFIVCMKDYIYNEKSLKFNISTYTFVSKIREVIQRGWKEAITQKSEEESDESEVPPFDEKGTSVTGFNIHEKFTFPKKEFALDTLLAFMEHPRGGDDIKLAGLGTPATRAEIIKILFSREYLIENKKKLYVTDRGLFLLSRLAKNEHLAKMTDVAQTTEWEKKLVENPKEFEKEIVEFVTLCVKSSSDRSTFQQKPLGSCPLCKKPVFETKMGYGCSGYKDNPKCSFTIWKTIAGAAISPGDASLLLIGQKTKVKKCKNKKDQPFEAAFALKGGNIEFVFK